MAGGVFVGEGLLKWLFPATLGVGRFSALGIPVPALLYDVRTDVAQLLSAILLYLGGAGPWALDALLARPQEGGGARAEPVGGLDGPVHLGGATDVAPGLPRRPRIAVQTGGCGQGRPGDAGQRAQAQTEGALMKDIATADAIAALVEGAAIQDALVHHRLALAWGHQVCTQLLQTWTALEAYEPLAYEDKVAGQLHVLEEATRSLWPLHQRLVQARRLLHRHRQHLQRRKTL
jgi:hypothetical protein